MLFSAYVAYGSYKLQKNLRSPRLVYSKCKYEFQYSITDNQFILKQWAIHADNVGGETAVVDRILFSIRIRNVLYMGRTDSDQFKADLVPPGAQFVTDLSLVLGDNSTWDLRNDDGKGQSDSYSTLFGVKITDVSDVEARFMIRNSIPDMSYGVCVLYRLDGTDIIRTHPYRLMICGSIKEEL